MLEFGKPETLQSGAIRVCAKAKLLVGHIVLDFNYNYFKSRASKGSIHHFGLIWCSHYYDPSL
jgi:hypothetical protein